MKFVVIGGQGRIGSKVVEQLKTLGHEIVVGSRRTGIDTLTGEGLENALDKADVLIDVSDSPSFEEKAVFEFFVQSTANLLKFANQAHVKHYVALSVVGVGRGEEGPYFRAKSAQEAQIRESEIPFTIVQTTQFFEFLPMIAMVATSGDEIRLPSALMQPLAADDAAQAVVNAALDSPVNGAVEIAGPERLPMNEIVSNYLEATGDKRQVLKDDTATYFGTKLAKETLVPRENAVVAKTKLADWAGKALVAFAAVITILTAASPSFAQDQKTKISLIFDHELPNVPGKSMKSVLVEYAPGGSTPAHTHPKSAFIYATVLEGSIKSGVNGGPAKTYKKGESFSENPGDLHSVSENASKSKPAKLLAVFVVDTDEKNLTTIIPSK